MHVEVPKKGALASFKAFAGEYAMIVISILTALALEHAATSWHHRHQAHEAEQRIEAEITYNLGELQHSLEKNRARLKQYAELRDFLRKGINGAAGLTGREKADYDAQMNRELEEKLRDGFNLSFSTPTLRREAWEVAVASQAASWMDAASLQRYSGVYAMQRDVAPVMASSLATLSGPSVMGALPQLRLKGEYKSRDLYQLMSDICMSMELLQGAMQTLEGSFKEAGAKARA